MLLFILFKFREYRKRCMFWVTVPLPVVRHNTTSCPSSYNRLSIVIRLLVHRHTTDCPPPYDRLSTAIRPVVRHSANTCLFFLKPTTGTTTSINSIAFELAELGLFYSRSFNRSLCHYLSHTLFIYQPHLIYIIVCHRLSPGRVSVCRCRRACHNTVCATDEHGLHRM